MATVTIQLAQKPSPDGTPCILQAQYDDVTNIVNDLVVTKQASYQPTIFVRDSITNTILLQQVVPTGSPITFPTSQYNYQIFRDSEGNIQVPWELQFG